MRVLAVDPGYDRLGVAVMEHNGHQEVVLHSACVITDRTTTLIERLATLGAHLQTLLYEYQPDCLAIEKLFFNKNVTTALRVAEIRGIALFLGVQAGATIYELSPQEIKVAVTGYGKSDKTAVIDMVQRLVPSAPQNALDDEYDAIAVGITCLAQYR